VQTVRLIREVGAIHCGHRGPYRGQAALQKALRERKLPWLKIGGRLRPGELPWLWSWEDKPLTIKAVVEGTPFVTGPNQLFENSRRPCRAFGERRICQAASCRLIFTESQWYARLIRQQLGPKNRAPIVVWPYPIDPLPGGPLPAECDLMIYAKGGFEDSTVEALTAAFPGARLVRYGRYRRGRMIELARRSRACAYLSDDDRGPLALAEIMLAGCPAAGVPRGAPWIADGRTGFRVSDLGAGQLIEAIARCHSLDRAEVRHEALARFDAEKTVDTILAGLQLAAEARR